MTLERDGTKIFRTGEPVRIMPPLPTALPDESCKGHQSIVENLRTLIEREIHEFEVELGAPAFVSASTDVVGPCFLIGPASLNPAFSQAGIPGSSEPAVWVDQERRLLVADAPSIGEIPEALSLLRTLTSTSASSVSATPCSSVDDCIERLQNEISWTYPGFELRGIDWKTVSERHTGAVQDADDPFPAFQRWVAELGDMHTWVQPDPPNGLLPYTVAVLPDRAVFVNIPEWTSAFDEGIRPGDVLLDVDTADALSRTGAPGHMRPYLAGRRFMSGPAGTERSFPVRCANGHTRSFVDTPSFRPHPEPITWTKLHTGTGYVKMLGFPPGTNDVLDVALSELESCPALIVDLRGNTGGMLTEALDFRDRFVERPMVMGTIRYSSPGGGLSEPFPIDAEPTSSHLPWPKPVRFLIDAMSASASEDALLGLQGLAHVKLIGATTAGGSGRPRSIRLLPGMRLSVSTALTFDRAGRCVEGNGLAPDTVAPTMLDGSDSEAIEIAERSW